MAKKIKISEQQAIRLFGKGAVLKLNEVSDGKYDSVGFDPSFRDPSIGKSNAMGNSVFKMRNLGNTKLSSDSTMKTGNDFVNTVVKYIYQINGGPVGIMDALDIVNKLKGKDVSKELSGAGLETPENVKTFLDTLDIATIFSNYLVMDQPDYVYYRLAHLSPEEIATIKETYGKDFATWGTKCDGCGLEEWQTNVLTQSGDDAHINLEYMGSAGKSGDGKSLGQMKSYRIPFEIHHMNENTVDNSPLNLSCLCPNCHSLTGSYARSKMAIDPNKLKQLEEKTKPVDTDVIAKEIKERLYTGHFQDMSLSKEMTKTSLPSVGINETELNEGVDGIVQNIGAWIAEHGTDIVALSATKTKPVTVGEIGGRQFFASVILDTKANKYWVRLFSDVGNSQDASSNFEGKLFEFAMNGPQREKMIDQIEAFVMRALTSTKPNEVKVTPWRGKKMNPANVGDMSKEKNPDSYNEKFKELNGFDPHSTDKVRRVSPEDSKREQMYNKAKTNFENAKTPSERKIWANLMKQFEPDA